MPNGDKEERIFYPTITQIIDSFSCSPLNRPTAFLYFLKKAPEVPEYAEM